MVLTRLNWIISTIGDSKWSLCPPGGQLNGLFPLSKFLHLRFFEIFFPAIFRFPNQKLPPYIIYIPSSTHFSQPSLLLTLLFFLLFLLVFFSPLFRVHFQFSFLLNFPEYFLHSSFYAEYLYCIFGDSLTIILVKDSWS
jgi:hypothetical protein